VRDIIVCGHSHCGAMQGLLNPEAVAELPAVRNWLSHADATARIMKENYSHISDPDARLTATVEENVLVQLENLRTHPAVAAAASRQALKVHGWVYKFETGGVFAFNPEASQFLALSDTSGRSEKVTEKLPSI
jgi:carbonic anhydrase